MCESKVIQIFTHSITRVMSTTLGLGFPFHCYIANFMYQTSLTYFLVSGENEKDEDSHSSSSLSCIFGDPSSDEYVPDSDIISDSDEDCSSSRNWSFVHKDKPTKIFPKCSTSTLRTATPHTERSGESSTKNQDSDTSVKNSRPSGGGVLCSPSDSSEVSSPSIDDDQANVDLEPPVKKHKMSKKRKKNEQLWKRVVAAKARESGESYVSRKGIVIPAKHINEDIICNEKCRLKCSVKIDQDQRVTIFNDFYKHNVNGKNIILFKSISMSHPKRKRKGAIKHKTASFNYTVTVGGNNVPVCKSAFMSLYQIGRKKISLIQDQIKKGLSAPDLDKRGKHSNRPTKLGEDVKKYVKEHIASFPAEESHYSRANNPNKKYLSPLLSVVKMHKLYLDKCKLDQVSETFFIKESMYRFVFDNEFNLSFGHPKSDTCSTCDSGQCTEEHVEFYKAAFEAQQADRESAECLDNVAYLTMDLQQTMPLPRLSTSKAFYKRQMWFYNLGLHITSEKVSRGLFCTWTEDVAKRGSTEVASSLLTATELDETLREKNHLIVWSDSCSGQNKNFQLVCLYQYMISKGYFKTIDHKFPEVGHSYLDSDRHFGRIEKNLRKLSNLYLPEQYRQIILQSTKGNQVVDMEPHFRKIDDLAMSLKLVNRKKDLLGETVRFRDGIKWIRIDEFGSYLYKESYDPNTPFRKVEILRYKPKTDQENPKGPSNCVCPNFIVPRINTKTGSLSAEKKEDIMQLLQYVPLEHRWYYEKVLQENQ